MKLAPEPRRGGLALGVAAKKPGRQPAWIIYALITFLLCPLPAKAFTSIVAFGDSYTDTGNAPSSPPDYWNGRFSNGPLWIEDLSQMLGFAYNAGDNYAVSGTESDELGVAIDNFPGTTDSANVLFAIWTGNNDMANHLDLGTDDSAWDTRINDIVSSCMTASDLLYNKGARNLVLFNVMDLTRCPDILNSYDDSFRSYIRGKIQLLNSRLAAAIPDLLSSHPGLQVFQLDTYSDFNYLLDNFVSLGFYQATIGALNDPTLADKSFNGPGANYVFWDDQHPTAMTHSLIAQWVANVLQGAPPPPTLSITAPANGAQFTAPASLSVVAAVVANGWNITQVNFYENGELFGQANSAPYSVPFTTDTPGAYTLTAQVIYGSGQTLSSGPIQISVVPPPGSPPPAPWQNQDIGDVGQAGTAYYASNGTFTVIGSGADIWDTADAFQYVYQPFTGDGSFIALITSVQDTDSFAKAGLMIRETLDPAARNALVFVTPSEGAGFQDRAAAGDITTYTAGPAVAAAYWLKLQRLGTNLNAYGSADGNQWALLGTTSISLPQTILVGLAVTAHNNSLLNTSTFANVQLVPSPTVVPPVLNLIASTPGAVQLTITGAVGDTYVCEASPDLVNWLPISTNFNSSGTLRLQLPQAGVQNFYRAYILR